MSRLLLGLCLLSLVCLEAQAFRRFRNRKKEAETTDTSTDDSVSVEKDTGSILDSVKDTIADTGAGDAIGNIVQDVQAESGDTPEETSGAGDTAASTSEEACRGETGDLNETQQNKVDKIIQLLQGRKITKIGIRVIKNQLKNPNSAISKLLGAAGQDPHDEDFDETRTSSDPVNPGLINLLSKFVGQTRTVIGYLWSFGFIAKVMGKSKVASENYTGGIPSCAVTNAIMEFQRFNKLPADGVLTKETRDLMAKDRCGNHDVKCETPECLKEDEEEAERLDRDNDHLRRKRYAVKSKIWKTVAEDGGIILKYHFENFYEPETYADITSEKTNHDVMNKEQVKTEVEKGLASWTKHAKLYFYETADVKEADIKIGFGSGIHSEKKESNAFDGQYGVLAHMFYPRSGKMHFDTAENYTAARSGSGINLYFVSAHEMGHGLGIEHSKTRGALMYPYYYGYKDEMLEADDIAAITALYPTGEGAVYPLGSFEETDVKEDTSKHVCIQKFTAGVSDPTDTYVYLFYKDQYVRLEPTDASKGKGQGYWPKVSEGYPYTVSDKWPGLVGPIDAAVTDKDRGISYFFSNGKVTSWNWNENSLGDLDQTPISETQFRELPVGITAVGRYNDAFVFFTADRYFIYSLTDGLVDHEGHPSPNQGLDEVAGAFSSFFNGYMYLTQNNKPEKYHLVRSTKLVMGGDGVNSVEEAKDAVVETFFDARFNAGDGVFGFDDNIKFECE